MRKLLKKITSTIILVILSPLGIIWDTTIIFVITGAAYFSWLYDKDVQDETYLDLLIDGYKWFLRTLRIPMSYFKFFIEIYLNNMKNTKF